MDKFFLKKKVLITGASYGLGTVIAKELDKLGSHLILSARSNDKLLSVLNSLKNKNNHVSIKCDLQSNVSIKKLCDHKIIQLMDQKGEIHVSFKK